MQTRLKALWEKIKGFFKKLNKPTRILLCVAAVIIVAAIASVLYKQYTKEPEYAMLCTGLTANETSEVVKFLGDNGVSDYKINNDTILVPAGRETQLWAQLASSRILTSGFLYDYYTEHTGSFSTEAERREAMRIATEQRLAAVIRQFEGVRDATVSISLGTDRVYVLQDSVTPSSAAVTITPVDDQQLSSGLVESIRYTVAHSEQRLNIEDISIVDIYGRPYNNSSTLGQASDASAMKLQFEQETNNTVRNGVLDILEPIYGAGNVRVTVNTTVDVDRRVIESTEYTRPAGSVNGGGLIGSEKWFWEIIREDGIEATGGVPGTTTNSDFPLYPNIDTDLNGEENLATGSGERDHELNTTTTQQEVLAGTITDVKVAVTINQNAQNAGALTVDELVDHVATASGIGTIDRNDPVSRGRVSVKIAPFAVQELPGGEEPGGTLTPGEILPGIPNWVIYAAAAGLLLFVILFVLIMVLLGKRRKKRLARQLALEAEQRAAEEAAAAEAEAAVAAILEEVPAPTGGADIMEVNTEKSMELRKLVRQFAQNNPEIAAQMVRAWLKGDEISA